MRYIKGGYWISTLAPEKIKMCTSLATRYGFAEHPFERPDIDMWFEFGRTDAEACERLERSLGIADQNTEKDSETTSRSTSPDHEAV